MHTVYVYLCENFWEVTCMQEWALECVGMGLRQIWVVVEQKSRCRKNVSQNIFFYFNLWMKKMMKFPTVRQQIRISKREKTFARHCRGTTVCVCALRTCVRACVCEYKSDFMEYTAGKRVNIENIFLHEPAYIVFKCLWFSTCSLQHWNIGNYFLVKREVWHIICLFQNFPQDNQKVRLSFSGFLCAFEVPVPGSPMSLSSSTLTGKQSHTLNSSLYNDILLFPPCFVPCQRPKKGKWKYPLSIHKFVHLSVCSCMFWAW